MWVRGLGLRVFRHVLVITSLRRGGKVVKSFEQGSLERGFRFHFFWPV